jgi:arylsulfate sulfotransferase
LADASEINANYIGDPAKIPDSDIHLNQYKNSPLAAVVNAAYPVRGKVRIVVQGQDGPDSDIEQTFDAYDYRHSLEVYGLYPDYENKVDVIFLSETGLERSKSTITISTEPLPQGFPTYEIVKNYDTPEKNVVFLMDFSPSAIPFMVDAFGKIRWYTTGFSQVTKFALQRFKNGNMGFGRAGAGQGSIFEYTMSGKLVREYSVYPTFEDIHHDVYEKSNGNLLVTVSKAGAATTFDYIVEIDRNSGTIIKTWDLNQILPKRYTFIYDEMDWLHVNAVIHDERDNTLIVSGQRQGIFKITYDNKLKWILAPQEGWEGYEAALLTNDNPNFEWNWGQHAPLITPEGNLMFFDNGFGRHYGNDAPFSRAVEFKITESTTGGTVDLAWEYGRERGEEMYSPIISDVDYLPETGNRLITTGSLSFVCNYTANSSIAGYFIDDPIKARIVEVDKDKNVKFEMAIKSTSVPGFVYRSEKIKIYE